MNEQHRWNKHAIASGVALLAAVVITTVLVAILPARHPVRVVAGLLLFIALPGIGFRDAFFRPSGGLASWEGMALAGVFGLAGSSLACLLIVITGIPLTATSVAASCAALSTSSAVIAFVRHGMLIRRRTRTPGLPLLVLALGSVVIGAVIGSAVAVFEPPEYFTVFTLTDPADARSAIESLADGSTDAIVRLTIESHESGTEQYQLLVLGEAPDPGFTLRPSETVVVEARIHLRAGTRIEIRLLKAGVPYRFLWLDSP